jgi:hypothetical protein
MPIDHRKGKWLGQYLRCAGLGMVLLFFLVALRILTGTPVTWNYALSIWLMLAGALCLTQSVLPLDRLASLHLRPYRGFVLLAAAAVAFAIHLHADSTWAAGVAVVCWFAWLLVVEGAYVRHMPWGLRWLLRLTLGVLVALAPVLIAQMESSFAEEEFFVALEALQLTVLWWGLALTSGLLQRSYRPPATSKKTVDMSAWINLAAGALVLLVAMTVALPAYWSSFFPPTAPAFPGVSETDPFLCGKPDPSAMPQPQGRDGASLLDDMVMQITARPEKSILDYGMLAVVTHQESSAQSFREAVLQEARANRFAGPAHSVKYIQNDAAQRVYYLIRLNESFPDLFSPEEWQEIGAWLRAVNQRALTVEWVDWMYATALAQLPEGPYENQENGLGLLALLQVLEAQQPEFTLGPLSAQNSDYLTRNQRGWFQRFRNTDDSYVYQPIWINNALFQSMYWAEEAAEDPDFVRRQKLSYEWLLLQALPDGGLMGYNHPARPVLALPAYQGASLTDDPQYLWLSDRSFDWLVSNDRLLVPWPGIEEPVAMAGEPPEEGSCLLYGDSGMPNQVGPLAPDKIVFREGWAQDSAYMLLNLRFSGWHRYKGTGSLVLAYRGGALASELFTGEPAPWLPVGRSQFRDKRIPRENVNGLLIQRTGLSQVIYLLAGAGRSSWAQDPPAYAQVDQFQTLGPLDIAQITLDDWHGWQQQRTVYFVHQGPALVVDEAWNTGSRGASALAWHLIGEGEAEGEGLWLRREDSPVRFVLPAEAWRSTVVEPLHAANESGLTPNWRLIYNSPQQGSLSLAAAFLWNGWADATLQSRPLSDGDAQHLMLTSSAGQLTLLHNPLGRTLAYADLETDAHNLLTILPSSEESQTICWVEASTAVVPLAWAPVSVTDGDAQPWTNGDVWQWREGQLFLQPERGGGDCITVWRR